MKKLINKWKPMPSCTKFLVFCYAVLIIYSIVEFTVSSITGVTHDVLTGCVFACFGGVETLGVTIIKVFKLKGENNELDD